MLEKQEAMLQLQRYYALWKDCSAMYEKWSAEQGLSYNAVLVLCSFYESEGASTQKRISERWNIPKQTVHTILKDFQKKGYVALLSDREDKRNKPVRLTESGEQYAKEIMDRLRERELYVIQKMGLENMKSLNDLTELLIRLFREGDLRENES